MGFGVSKAGCDAQALADALRDHDNIDTALAAYNRIRQPIGEVIVKHSRRLGTHMGVNLGPLGVPSKPERTSGEAVARLPGAGGQPALGLPGRRRRTRRTSLAPPGRLKALHGARHADSRRQHALPSSRPCGLLPS
jgi:2-polyprenyl-6-methoxyphenol hydroxylase-like FAD-dependent oxidoreductase